MMTAPTSGVDRFTDYLGLAYGFSSTNNNGNVRQQTIGESGLTHTQHYADAIVNRLTMASEGALPAANCPGGAAWCRRYGYDAFGNQSLLESPGLTSMPGITSFDPSTNRLTTAGYDFSRQRSAEIWHRDLRDLERSERSERSGTASQLGEVLMAY